MGINNFEHLPLLVMDPRRRGVYLEGKHNHDATSCYACSYIPTDLPLKLDSMLINPCNPYSCGCPNRLHWRWVASHLSAPAGPRQPGTLSEMGRSPLSRSYPDGPRCRGRRKRRGSGPQPRCCSCRWLTSRLWVAQMHKCTTQSDTDRP